MGSPLGLFNLVDKDNKPITKNYTVYDGGADGKGQKVKSLFDNTTVFSPFPEGSIDSGSGTTLKIKKWADIHNDNIYDTSISSIVKYTSKFPAMKLDFIDFAYLRDVGVYPNNRLIVARRFGAAVGNDLTRMKVPPLKTMVSWVSEAENDFLSVSYNEVWNDADATYTEVLNKMGKSFKSPGSDNSTNIGDFLAGGIGLVPFPGLSEPIQRAVAKEFGIIDGNAFDLPLGDPNLIREAKKRSTVQPDQAGSGLACNIEIKMVVEYEQKFINGVDPTLAYMDIIQNAIYFGTSDARFQFSKAFAEGAKGILGDLISGDYNKIYKTLEKIVKAIFNKLKEFISSIVKFIDKTAESAAEGNLDIGKQLNAFVDVSTKAIGSVIGKYKQDLLGVTNALTGAPSTPWHITIGNPKKPVFCSGDMLLKKVDMEMGKILAYNDLPSTIKFTLTFENARPLGAQEIFNRLNTGRGRSVLSVSLQSATNKKPDGTINTSGGSQKDKIFTKSFEASPIGGEDKTSPDYQYATTEGNGTAYNKLESQKPITGPVNANDTSVNLSEAQRNDSGQLISPANTNQGNLAPSANSGQAQIVGTQPNTPQLSDPNVLGQSNAPAENSNLQTPFPVNKGRERSPSSVLSGQSPLSQSQINSSPASQLEDRSKFLKNENAGLSQEKIKLDQVPPGETLEQKDERLKKKANIERKILSNGKEEDSIKKELLNRQSTVVPFRPTNIIPTGIPGIGI
jgi:hypothetical protein